MRSRVRFSSLHGGLYVHSAYPTTDALAVFFGPDTYRFCRAIGRDARPARRVVDIGCGSGAGGLIAGKGAARVVLADVNDAALVCSRVNAALAGVHHAETVRSDIFASVDGQFDRIVANPPYMLDASRRVYRDGGGRFGEEISLRIVREASERLAPGGTLLLYTGTAVIEGRDTFLDAAAPMLQELGMPFRYEEIDPDVFGEELERPGYAAVDRIAAVLLTLSRAEGQRGTQAPGHRWRGSKVFCSARHAGRQALRRVESRGHRSAGGSRPPPCAAHRGGGAHAPVGRRALLRTLPGRARGGAGVAGGLA